MSYQSQLPNNALVISDDNYLDLVNNHDQSFGRGYEGRDYSQHPEGSLYYLSAPPFQLIDRAEWPERIKEMEATKSRLSDSVILSGLPSKDQGQTNYCWINAPAGAMEALRASDGLPYLNLSAASGGARIKGFKNVGGWCGEAVEWIAQNGLATTDFWPTNKISREYDTEETRANSVLHKINDWAELPTSKIFDWVMSALFNRLPVCVGLSWWGHAIYYLDPAMPRSGVFGVKARNSWGASYGDNGYFYLEESKARPDEAVVPYNTSPSIRSVP